MYRCDPQDENRGDYPGFQVRRDDYSLQLWARVDRLFFIRIDTDTPGLVISDLHPGGLPHALVVQALGYAIDHAGRSKACMLTVRDIAPNGDVDARAAGLHAILALYATRRRLALSSWELVARGARTDLAARFSQAD